MKRLVGLVLLITLIAIPVIAEKYALLVGINDYPDEISSLKYCVADVEAFSQALVEVAGFAEKNVYLMTSRMSGRKEPTNINVIRDLDLLSKRVKPEDTFLFYFAGHGITKGEKSFLLATNSDTTTPNTLELSAIPLETVKEILSGVQAQQLLMVIDACRNDPNSGRGEEDNLLTNEFSRGFKIKRSRDNSGRPSVSATLYACNIGERAYEWVDKGHGVFSYYLLEGLKGKAANSRGEVVVTDLADYTQREVMRWAEDFRGKKQTPWLDQSGGAKLVLVEDPLASLEAQNKELEAEIAKVKQQLEVAKADQDSTAENDARLRRLKKNLRNSEIKKEALLQQEIQAKLKREEEQRLQKQQSEEEARKREEFRQKQTEIERKQKQLEAERKKLKSLQEESMDISQLLNQAAEIHGQIEDIRQQVKNEVEDKIEKLPLPSRSNIHPQGEFEKTIDYQNRIKMSEAKYQQDKEDYEDNVRKIRRSEQLTFTNQSAEFHHVLKQLNQHVDLNESVLLLSPGSYNADKEVFDQATIALAQNNSPLPKYQLKLSIPASQAPKFKQSVEEDLIKIQASVYVDADKQTATLEKVRVEDIVHEISAEGQRIRAIELKQPRTSIPMSRNDLGLGLPKLSLMYGICLGSSYPIVTGEAIANVTREGQGNVSSVVGNREYTLSFSPQTVPLGTITAFANFLLGQRFGLQPELGWSQSIYRWELPSDLLMSAGAPEGDTLEIKNVTVDAKILFQYRIPLHLGEETEIGEMQLLIGPVFRNTLSAKGRVFMKSYSPGRQPDFTKPVKPTLNNSKIDGWVLDIAVATESAPFLTAKVRFFYGVYDQSNNSKTIIPQLLIGFGF